MKITLRTIPFHYLYPCASPDFRGCVAVIPVHNPKAPERSIENVRLVMRNFYRAAVSTVCGGEVKSVRLPKTVILPVTKGTYIHDRRGGCEIVRPKGSLVTTYLTCSLKDLAEKPFKYVQFNTVPKKRLTRFLANSGLEAER